MKYTFILFLLLFILPSVFAQRISELPAASTVKNADLMLLVQDGVTKKVPYSVIVGGISVVPPPTYWEPIDTNIFNTNIGFVGIRGQMKFDPIPPEANKLGRFLHLGSYGIVEYATIHNIRDELHEDQIINGWTYDTSRMCFSARGVCYGNGLFVAVGDSIMYSHDGTSWTFAKGIYRDIYEVPYGFTAVTYGNGMFVAVGAGSGSDNNIAVSDNGIEWKIAKSIPYAPNILDIAYGHGLFVAVGNDNVILTSHDGIYWDAQTPPGDGDFDGVCYGDNLFVAVGDVNTGEQVITSPDGITWSASPNPSPTDRSWWGIAYGNGLYVATSTAFEDSTVMTSPDAINWTVQLGDNSTSWSRIIYAEGQFMASGFGQITDHIMTSPDGVTWTKADTYDYIGSFGLCYGNGKYIAVYGPVVHSNGTITKYDPSDDNNFQGDWKFNNDLDVEDTANIGNLKIGGSLVTSNAAEINTLKGVTQEDTVYIWDYHVNVDFSTGIYKALDPQNDDESFVIILAPGNIGWNYLRIIKDACAVGFTWATTNGGVVYMDDNKSTIDTVPGAEIVFSIFFTGKDFFITYLKTKA